MDKQIRSALISVFYKDGLENIIQQLNQLGVTIYSTGGTQTFIESLGVKVIPVEDLTGYPSILGGRVKTLHPSVFGGILGKREDAIHVQEMEQYKIPTLDLVIVDLYPFEETVASTTDEKAIIEKIDIGGPSMIRAAAKNYKDVTVIAAKKDYAYLENILQTQKGQITLEQRKELASKAFATVAHYDVAIANYFDPHGAEQFLASVNVPKAMRYGENPHQAATFYGNLEELFTQLHGKELSYNNIVDVDAALQLIREFESTTFAIIKHTNVCGVAQRNTVKESWEAALAGDPESAFGGVLVCNGTIDLATAEAINAIFFEVLIAPNFEADALALLSSKKNRILLELKKDLYNKVQYKSALNGVLVQDIDDKNIEEWREAGARPSTASEKEDLQFANIICKHLKSNAIALVHNKQLIGKGCGQTSRIDSLRQAVDKARQFNANLKGAVMASDAFFPFRDGLDVVVDAGASCVVQPGGSMRDQEVIDAANERGVAMVFTGVRHFRH